MNTRSGEMVSPQVAKLGNIEGLQDSNFSLPDGQALLLKNEGNEDVYLEVTPAGMDDGTFIETRLYPGWNPEIIKAVKQTSLSNVKLKWGY